jgi:predicted transcriptional regulator
MADIQDIAVKEPVGSRTLELDLEDQQTLLIFKALSSKTRWNLLKILALKLDVCETAKKLNQTEANISAQMKILEKAHLIVPKFEVGRHGVKKVCELNLDRIVINI